MVRADQSDYGQGSHHIGLPETLTELVRRLRISGTSPNEEELPGFGSLFDENCKPRHTTEEEFFKVILGVFRSSIYHEHYESELKKYGLHGHDIDAFVTGTKSVEQIQDALVASRYSSTTQSYSAASNPRPFRGFIRVCRLML